MDQNTEESSRGMM